MKNGRIQAKDIPDNVALEAIWHCGSTEFRTTRYPEVVKWASACGVTIEQGPAMWWDVTNIVSNRLGRLVHAGVVRAKMKSLIRRGLARGCACGCRGNFMLTREGESALAGPNVVVKELEAILDMAPKFYPESPDFKLPRKSS